MTRVLVSASSALVRAGLEALIASGNGVAVTARTYDPRTFLDDVDALHPDVVVLSAEPDDEDVLASVQAVSSSPRSPAVVAVREGIDPAWVAEALRAGVRAVVPREVTTQELNAAIEAAAAGLTVLPSDFLSAALTGLNATRRSTVGDSKLLTPREIEVLHMLAGGLGNKAIARRLGISAHTVKYHVGSIMTKLGASSRTEAVTIGIRQGLVLL